jgi:O-antigen/teichoic acid export membrane protein
MTKSVQRKFITNLIILLSLNLLIKPFWILGIDRTVQNIVGAHDYGFYFAIFNFSFLFNILLDMGITNFNNKNIAQHDYLLNKHFSSILILRFLLAVIYLIITITAGLIIGYDSHQMFLLLILAFNQFLITFILYLRSNISGLHFFKTDSMVSVLDRIFMIGICGVLLWGNVTNSPFKIEWLVYSQTGAYLLTAIIALAIVFKKAEFEKLNWNYPFFIMIIKKSLPFAVLILLMTFYNRIDSVMIERILPERTGETQSGIYASAYRLLDATNMIAYLFSVLLLPLFARMLKQKESVEKLVKLSFTLLITAAIIIASGSNFYSYELMQLLYREHIEASAGVFGLLMSGFIAISTTYVFGTLLTANGNLKQLNIVAASGMIINISLNFFLIPKFEAIGSAYASLITQFITAALQVIIVQYFFRFKINYTYLSTLVIFAAGVILITYISKGLHFEWTINFLIMVIASLLLASALRLLSIKSLLKIVKKEEEEIMS